MKDKTSSRPALWVCAGLTALFAALCLLSVVTGSARPETLPAAVETVRRIDLNTATAEELCALPGIGEALSERILERREELGGFSSTEDVLSVRGIGETTWANIAPYVTLGGTDS